MLIYLLMNLALLYRTLWKSYMFAFSETWIKYKTKCYDYHNYLFIYLSLVSEIWFYLYLTTLLSIFFIDTSLTFFHQDWLLCPCVHYYKIKLQNKEYKICREEFIYFIFCIVLPCTFSQNGKMQRKMQRIKLAQDLIMHSVDFSNKIAFTSDFSEWSMRDVDREGRL